MQDKAQNKCSNNSNSNNNKKNAQQNREKGTARPWEGQDRARQEQELPQDRQNNTDKSGDN